MKSIANEYWDSEKESMCFFEKLEKFELNHYKQKNELAEAKEEIERLKFELTKFQADDILSLIDISKRLNKTLKGSGEDEMVSQLMLERAKIMDHFTLAYLADTGFKPSEIKLVQGMNNRTEMFEMYFEKITTIIL